MIPTCVRFSNLRNACGFHPVALAEFKAATNEIDSLRAEVAWYHEHEPLMATGPVHIDEACSRFPEAKAELERLRAERDALKKRIADAPRRVCIPSTGEHVTGYVRGVVPADCIDKWVAMVVLEDGE